MIDFDTAFHLLTTNEPFPWQRALYERFLAGNPPAACALPTGLGKTTVIPLWLIALANAAEKVPRRMVYVVNRRTVVDQATREAELIRARLSAGGDLSGALKRLCASESELALAISTLRGQFADNREWSADPCRPAIIIGTVDMIGSRLLFSGYGVGFKAKPLHAGFLGQDVLLVHDEAHLEPAFQKMLLAIESEQKRCGDLAKLRVMELSATSRSSSDPFTLTAADCQNATVKARIMASKSIILHESKDDKKLADELSGLALQHRSSDAAILVYARRVDDVSKIVARLEKEKQKVQHLTGTLRGLERDTLVQDPVFVRFLPPSSRPHDVTPEGGTVYLVCTSAGEVGVNISADHLVCDLSTFDSMAQRFGRVNRFGERDDTRIDVLHPTEFDLKDPLELRLSKTLALLRQLNGDGSPHALGELDLTARLEAFARPPTILPVSDILFDAWALTTIRGELQGRPPVEPYLHGIDGPEPPETHVAWREEVDRITKALQALYKPEDLLEDYPLKPHELLRDSSTRVFDRLKKLDALPETPVWTMDTYGEVSITTLGEIVEAGKEQLEHKIVLLPPSAGGLEKGMLVSSSKFANDVADEWLDDRGQARRCRSIWDDQPRPAGMRLIRTIDTNPNAEESAADEIGKRWWHWYELASAGDGDGSRSNQLPVPWQVHTDDVARLANQFVEHLPLSEDLKEAIRLAAQWHDLGKRRELWQRGIGNPNPSQWLGKSGGSMRPREITAYRHEFGSLHDVLESPECSARFQSVTNEMQDVVLHLIAVHHGMGRPHFPAELAFDPSAELASSAQLAAEVPRRFARLQRKYGRWGLAYLESLLRAADWAASANPSEFIEEHAKQ
jgi:CRISPR-associated endonuclease/helicase Cas3